MSEFIRAINIALRLNAGHITILGELCQLQENLSKGYSIEDNVEFLKKCRNKPGISQILTMINPTY